MKVDLSTHNSTLTTLSRITLFICGLGLLVVLFAPIWRIDLMAPQYPEGLRLLIYANNLAGNVDIINGLNHYIGMKTLHADDFVEFKVLPYIIVFFSICFIAVAIAAKRKWMNILFVLFVAFGILAMVDFWRWEYSYGHDLNPDAAIKVPGMAYQPPLIGYKQLLNFGAWSVPDIGGWIFIAVGALLLSAVVYEWRRRKKIITQFGTTPLWFIGVLTLALTGCSTDPEPIRTGQDNCNFCKMTISDKRFGAEIVTQKGKIYKFDDAHCLNAFMDSNKVGKAEIAGVYFTDFIQPHELTNVEQAYFLQSPKLKSPMNGNIAAFSREDSLTKMLPQYPGFKITWEDVQK
ncbi:nitrous oxide reductase accessory protein NosL [Daejeonella oryzae]|uniref:nitrous oxide reductase accessory protein NosL n=1 Tax=Daejeonella oryzae TaxID=1122943 RepID=UPI0003F7BAFC|nr:nitrous oxide reductase accessory protein NosL [Daejeonella oryzae]